MDVSSVIKPYRDYPNVRGDKQMMIQNSIGRQLPFIVNFENSTCQIFDIVLERVTHTFVFPESCELIDVDYFPTPEGEFGIIIGVEDNKLTWGSEHFLLGLTTDTSTSTLRVTHSLDVPSRVTVVKTLYSINDMTEGRENGNLGLFHKLLEWPHVVAIGCKRSKCFLASLLPVNGDTEIPEIHVPKKSLIDLMGAYVNDDVFTYTIEDGAFREYPTSGVYVSSVALMPRSRTLLVGLSMGGIIAASLNSSNQMSLLDLRQERRIHSLAPLEPEDDPDKFEYFIVAVDGSVRHQIILELWRGSFQKDLPDDEKYDRPSYSCCLAHRIAFGERWLSVKTIVQERSLDLIQRRRNDSTADSMLLNSSQIFGCTVNRSNVFLSYEKKMAGGDSADEPAKTVEAAIFDIDAWYYKRVPGRVIIDDTVLRQCPFMSCIRSEIHSNDVNDVGILTLDSTDSYRFTSMISDADQLFYPSALAYNRVFVSQRTRTSWMRISSIQDTILQKCASKLPWAVRSPETMAARIIAVGLVRKNILTGSPNSSAAEIMEEDQRLSMNQRVVLNAVVYYGKNEEFCNLVSNPDLSDRIKVDIADWAFLEAVEFKRIISDRVVSLFQGSTSSLSPLAEDTLQQGIKMFRLVYEYLRRCSKYVKENGVHLENYALSAKCLYNHTKLVRQFIGEHIVPVNNRIELLMRQKHEKKKNTALKNKTALPVQVTTRSMHRVSPNAQFWNGLPHDEWYPPTPLDLLEVILNVSIPERLKRDIIIQYSLDYVRSSSLSEESENYTDKKLAIEVIKIMSDQTLNVDLEKIFCVIEEERLALQKQTIVTQQDNSGTLKSVFSLDEGLSYEKLWSGEVNMEFTIKPTDLEKFKIRMKIQEEADGENRKKLAVLDSETEKMYQVYLYEHQKYHLMSQEAIESNELLRTFFPKLLQKDRRQPVHKPQQKTAKELEIEKSVKEMFEKQYKRDQLEIPQVYAGMGGERNQVTAGGGGKKRRSEVVDEERSTSPTTFVPPTAKRIQQRVRTPENVTIEESTVADPDRQDENEQLNQIIATPARYYRRPAPVVEMISPTDLQKAPPLPKQNSILKTAKQVQSPGRGRIRFHASVRKGPNESVESASDEPGDILQEEEITQPKKIDFMVLEDEAEEQPTYVRRTRSNSATQETATQQSQINQMEVVEEEIQETTFELQEEDEHIKSLEEGATYEDIQMEITSEVGEEEEDVFHEAESTSQMNEIVQKLDDIPESTEVFDEPEWDGIERSFEHQNDADCDPSPIPEQPIFKAPLQLPRVDQEAENIPVQPVEIPSSNIVEESEDVNSKELDNEISEDVPLDRTFELQDEEDPKPLGDNADETVGTSETFVVKKSEESKKQQKTSSEEATGAFTESFERPPSANLRSRSRTQSRSESVTPEENIDKDAKSDVRKQQKTVEKTSEVQEAEKTERPVSRTRAGRQAAKIQKSQDGEGQTKIRTIQKTTEIQEDIEEIPKRSSSRTRTTRAASKTPEISENDPSSEKTERKPRGTSVTRSSRKAQIVIEEDTSAKEVIRPSSRSRRAASVNRENQVEGIQAVPEKEEVDRPVSRSRRAASVKKDTNTEETPRVPVRRTPSRTRSRLDSEVVSSEEPEKQATEEVRPASRSRRAASVKKDTIVEETPKRRTPSRTRSRLNSEVTEKTEEVIPKSTRKSVSRATSVIPDENVATKTTRGRRVSERQVTPISDEAPEIEKGSTKRVGTKTIRATSVQPETNPAPTASAKRAARGSASAPSTPKRATKRRNNVDDTEEGPAMKSAKGRSLRATPLMAIPESDEASKTSDTPRRGRPRSISAPSVPATPRQGRKGASVATGLEDVVEEEEEEAPLSVRRSARRPKKP